MEAHAQSVVKLFMNIQNTGTNAITPRVAGAWGMLSRLRVRCGGAIIEDIDLHGRLHEQFHLMKPTATRVNDAVEGFGDDRNALASGKERVLAFTP